MFHDRFPTWARARGLSRGLAALLVLAMAPVLATDTRPLAFPGAQGAAAHTPGGRGGSESPGSGARGHRPRLRRRGSPALSARGWR